MAAESKHWHDDPTLAAYLASVDADRPRQQAGAFRLPVQSVNRDGNGLPVCRGSVAGGAIKPGDRIRVQPSGRESAVARIVTTDATAAIAGTGQTIALTLADGVDVSPGDMISAAGLPAEVADQFEATLAWSGAEPMLPGRAYGLRINARGASATITELKHKVDPGTHQRLAARTLGAGEIGVCNLSLDQPVPFDAYTVNRETAGFMLTERETGERVGAGILHFALRRAHNIHLQFVDIDKAARATLNGQRPALIWLTGLSGAGKSTIANLVEKKLHAMGRRSYLLDGDNVRHGLNRDLGFTDADRVENIRRVAEVARLMVDAGLIVIAAFISPFRAERAMARALLAEGEFIEVHVDTPLEVAESRDVKGLYEKARRGELRNFTGVDSPYEPPESPELRVSTATRSADDAADQVIAKLRELGLVT